LVVARESRNKPNQTRAERGANCVETGAKTMNTYEIKIELVETCVSIADKLVKIEAESLEEAQRIAEERANENEYNDDFENKKFEIVDYHAEFRIAKEQGQ
jgi:hypothetical protein